MNFKKKQTQIFYVKFKKLKINSRYYSRYFRKSTFHIYKKIQDKFLSYILEQSEKAESIFYKKWNEEPAWMLEQSESFYILETNRLNNNFE